jgi:hypothetical protein
VMKKTTIVIIHATGLVRIVSVNMVLYSPNIALLLDNLNVLDYMFYVHGTCPKKREFSGYGKAGYSYHCLFSHLEQPI